MGTTIRSQVTNRKRPVSTPAAARRAGNAAILGAVLAAGAAASPAWASEFGVNFIGGAANGSLSTSAIAGVTAVAQDDWNSLADSTGVIAATTVTDNTGDYSATVSVTGTTDYLVGGPAFNNSSDANIKLLNGFVIDKNSAATNATTTDVTNIPQAYQTSGYSVYVYFDYNSAPTYAGQVSLTPALGTAETYYYAPIGESTTTDTTALADGSSVKVTDAGGDTDFQQTTATTAATVMYANYAVFSGLNADSFTILNGFSTNTSEDYGISGFQIVQTPEPASVALLSMGAMGLLTRRRRRS